MMVTKTAKPKATERPTASSALVHRLRLCNFCQFMMSSCRAIRHVSFGYSRCATPGGLTVGRMGIIGSGRPFPDSSTNGTHPPEAAIPKPIIRQVIEDKNLLQLSTDFVRLHYSTLSFNPLDAVAKLICRMRVTSAWRFMTSSFKMPFLITGDLHEIRCSCRHTVVTGVF